MNRRKICRLFLAMAIPMFLFGCGGDGGSGSSSSTGTVSMDITDTKPMLPLDVEQVIIKFDAVSVHKAGGGWLVLPLAEEAQTPYEIDLLQFTDGDTTEFVPPTELEAGHYTQIRIEVIEAKMIPLGGGDDIPLIISSNDVKTDKQFDFDVTGGGAVAVVIDFDLSQSIVATGDDTYKLKPVLHINYTQEAATIVGRISNSDLTASEATIVVTARDEEYTRVVVEKDTLDPTVFNIYWLVPEEEYFVQIDLDGNQGVFEYEEIVSARDLPASAIFELNGGDNIPSPTP